MEKKYKMLIKALGENRVMVNELLFKYTSFRLGGPADLFYRAKTTLELTNAVKQTTDLGISCFVMGGGTNILVSDKGYRGLVVKNDTSNIFVIGSRGGKFKNKTKNSQIEKIFLEVDSGVGVNRLVRYTLDQGFVGLEYFLGQPGTVGGAVWINAHNMNMGKYFGDFVVGAKIFNPKNGIMIVDGQYFRFGYDTSSIQKNSDLVISVILQLGTGDKKKLWKTAKQAYEYRTKTQPKGVYSSGCTFRNISKSTAIRLSTPQYTCSAGYLLDSCKLKGIKKGHAQFSGEHANFIIHQGEATTSDVLELIKLAKTQVKKKYKIDLDLEIVIVGEF